MLVAILQELFTIILDIEKGAMFKFEGINRYSTIWKDPCCPNRCTGLYGLAFSN